MGTTDPFKDKSLSLTKRLLPWTICALLPIALLRLFFYPLTFSPRPETDLPHSNNISITYHSSLSASPPSSAEKGKINETKCDYSNGEWVSDSRGPLYNDTTCGTIKDGRNCITHGRPDSGYLHWRWKPSECHLPRFEPQTFLQLIKNKHIAFVGDSMARNQLESLLCMLATASTPNLVYQNGKDNKFSRWRFPSHNASISLYWSPFLVNGVEKSSTNPNNLLYLDHVDERWARDMDQMDLVVLSFGHWLLLPAVYHEGESVLGCHYCPGLNHTEIGFFDVLRKALRTTLNSIVERRGARGNDIGVIVTTFTPHHFEGEWDKAGACPKTMPYRNGEKQLEGMDADMRKIEIEEVEDAKAKASAFGRLRLEALDVTKLALLRPDGHPGPYMNPFPFVNGNAERVQNDCVHWCLPGPIDTWNEIFLEMMKKWEQQSRSED
ncbi:ALTERED XYLOGLUCAN 4 protein [Spatholobus suberectus]|nr:ALTERED XYLOGLUCAN 4 protein [Spatholobus suberectus]